MPSTKNRNTMDTTGGSVLPESLRSDVVNNNNMPVIKNTNNGVNNRSQMTSSSSKFNNSTSNSPSPKKQELKQTTMWMFIVILVSLAVVNTYLCKKTFHNWNGWDSLKVNGDQPYYFPTPMSDDTITDNSDSYKIIISQVIYTDEMLAKLKTGVSVVSKFVKLDGQDNFDGKKCKKNNIILFSSK